MTDSADDPRHELTAYLDGELDERAAAEIEARLRHDPAMQREAETLKRTWDLLDFLPQPEPSATFASQTLDKLAVLKPRSTATPKPAGSPSMIAARKTRPKSAWPTRAALAVTAITLFLVGYIVPAPFLTKRPARLSAVEAERLMAKDLRLIDQLPLLMLGDEFDFLVGLDNPDLFGE